MPSKNWAFIIGFWAGRLHRFGSELIASDYAGNVSSSARRWAILFCLQSARLNRRSPFRYAERFATEKDCDACWIEAPWGANWLLPAATAPGYVTAPQVILGDRSMEGWSSSRNNDEDTLK